MVRLVEDDALNARYGIWFDYQDDYNFIYFGISNPGEYRVAVIQSNSNRIEIQDWTPHPAIRRGAATNILTIETEPEGKVTLGVNGEQVATFTDKTFDGGSIAFFCYAETVPTTCRLERCASGNRSEAAVPLDFTLAAFDEFCQRLTAHAGLHRRRLPDSHHAAPHSFLILRLDVDYRERHAVYMARIADRYDLRGSFYFRRGTNGFNLEAIRAVAALDHEVGYHFETLDICRGDFDQAEALLLDHLDELRAEGLTIRTVAAHGSTPTAPTYRRNLDLFVKRPDLFERADLLGETTLSIDFAKVTYLSDATWAGAATAIIEPGTTANPHRCTRSKMNWPAETPAYISIFIRTSGLPTPPARSISGCATGSAGECCPSCASFGSSG